MCCLPPAAQTPLCILRLCLSLLQKTFVITAILSSSSFTASKLIAPLYLFLFAYLYLNITVVFHPDCILGILSVVQDKQQSKKLCQGHSADIIFLSFPCTIRLIASSSFSSSGKWASHISKNTLKAPLFTHHQHHPLWKSYQVLLLLTIPHSTHNNVFNNTSVYASTQFSLSLTLSLSLPLHTRKKSRSSCFRHLNILKCVLFLYIYYLPSTTPCWLTIRTKPKFLKSCLHEHILPLCENNVSVKNGFKQWNVQMPSSNRNSKSVHCIHAYAKVHTLLYSNTATSFLPSYACATIRIDIIKSKAFRSLHNT